MRSLKAILLSSVIAVAAVTTVFTSCEEDLCKNVVCANGGTCDINTGKCVCTSGWEGADCKTASRDKFLSATGYKVVEDGTASLPATYTVTVQKSGVDSSAILISNFWNSFITKVVAKCDGNKITIARQEPDGDKFFVEGNGTLSGNVITLKYKVTNEAVPTAIVTDDFGLVAGNPSVWTKQ